MPLPPDFWEKELLKLAAIIRPRLVALALAGAFDGNKRLYEIGFRINDDQINIRAVEWARQYAETLQRQLNLTSEKLAGGVVASWMETPGATVGDLNKALLPILDDNKARAWRIATTEVTRAYAEGNDQAHQAAGFQAALYKPPSHVNCRCGVSAYRHDNEWIQVWNTANDEIVCRQPVQTPWGVRQGCYDLHGTALSGRHAGEKVIKSGQWMTFK